MSVLSDLPPELLVEIFRFLPGHSLLRSIPLVCRQFLGILHRHEDFLFHPLLLQLPRSEQNEIETLIRAPDASWKRVYTYLAAPVLAHSCYSEGTGNSMGTTAYQHEVLVQLSGRVSIQTWSRSRFRGMNAPRVAEKSSNRRLNRSSLRRLNDDVLQRAEPYLSNYVPCPVEQPLYRQGKPQLYVGPKGDFLYVREERKRIGSERARTLCKDLYTYVTTS